MIALAILAPLAVLAGSSGTSNASTEKVLYAFTGGADGAFPVGPLAVGKKGVLYGNTANGGLVQSGCQSQGCGTVFSLTPPAAIGGAYAFAAVYMFGGVADGSAPEGSLLIDSSGVLGAKGVIYGTTALGGPGCATSSTGCGTVYSLTPPKTSGGSWTETILHSFTGGSDGQEPLTGLIGVKGVLYGTTIDTVYSLAPPATAGGAWTETPLHFFQSGSTTDGFTVRGGLIADKNGVLYGTTEFGGPNYNGSMGGTVFSLTPPTTTGGTWVETLIDTFGLPNDGFFPVSGLIGQGGVLYGVTPGGGPEGGGLVYSLTPPSTTGGAWTETFLHSFFNGNVDFDPQSGLVGRLNGTLYGTTDAGIGTVYSVTPPATTGGTWTEEVLYSFTGGGDGANPSAAPVIGGKTLFGTTELGGGGTLCGNTSGCGTVYSITP